jgi:hypothetical protein
MVMLYLQFLMVMVVRTKISIGPEVSKYVSDVFVSVLKSTEEYKKKDYVKAMDETFRKVDEMIDSE